MRLNGGYDEGYKSCPCFWGREPGSFVLKLGGIIGSFDNLKILDVGCGEGKNAAFCATHGAVVRALDTSGVAIEKAKVLWEEAGAIQWEVGDIRYLDLPSSEFDIVLAYGVVHCLSSGAEIVRVVSKLQEATKVNGYNVVCVMNNREQELDAHPDLEPCLLPHKSYLSLYQDWHILAHSDSDLHETHPHNCIPHKHSMTRLIALRVR